VIEAGSQAAVAGSALERLGWRNDEPAVRDIVPPAARGTNLVLELPPAVAWAGPLVAGLATALSNQGGRVLVLAAPGTEDEWGSLWSALTRDTTLRIEAAHGPARAARHLRANAVDVLIGAPDTILALHTRSALAPERVTAIILAWPEAWDDEEAVSLLLQDLPKEAQRIVLTSRPEQADVTNDLIERYARKALRFGGPEIPGAPLPPVAPASTLATSWSGRAGALALLLEGVDPASVTIWTVDRRDHPAIRAAVGGGDSVSLAVRSIPAQGPVVCYDPPTREALRALAAVGEVYLLVPPGTESHVARIASPRRPVQAGSSLTALSRRGAADRHEVARVIERGSLDAELYTLAPLFENHEPQQVAAALLRLWRAAQKPEAPPTASVLKTSTPVGGVEMAKIWIGVGKKDDAAVGDFVAVLVKEVGLDRTLIGRIDLRDSFALVEVPMREAERVILGLNGVTIRRRRVVARLDASAAAGGGNRPGKAPPRGKREY
jgi:hypothetical protein